MNDGEALRRRIEDLSPMGVRFVARMVESLSDPPQAQGSAPAPTWITAESGWIEYFGLLISVHHGLAVDALKETGFENAFRDACEAVGWRVAPPTSATRRFVDVTVQTRDGRHRRLSLKSTAAQRLSKLTIHISKLTEAAWIQDVRSARSRRTRTLGLFEEYCAAVDAILMLRAFRDDPRSSCRPVSYTKNGNSATAPPDGRASLVVFDMFATSRWQNPMVAIRRAMINLQ